MPKSDSKRERVKVKRRFTVQTVDKSGQVVEKQVEREIELPPRLVPKKVKPPTPPVSSSKDREVKNERAPYREGGMGDSGVPSAG